MPSIVFEGLSVGQYCEVPPLPLEEELLSLPVPLPLEEEAGVEAGTVVGAVGKDCGCYSICGG